LVTAVIEPTDVCHLHLIQTGIADSRFFYPVDVREWWSWSS
jgi:hypothetical protein